MAAAAESDNVGNGFGGGDRSWARVWRRGRGERTERETRGVEEIRRAERVQRGTETRRAER